MPIGNALDAAIARTYPYELLIGDGMSREAFLINNVVYKVSRDFPEDNVAEYRNIMSVTTAPDFIVMPEVTLYDDVIAMEYVEGRETGICVRCIERDKAYPCDYFDCAPVAVAEWCEANGITDVGHGNIIEYAGRYYPIDFVS